MLKNVKDLKIVRNKVLKEEVGITLEFTEYEGEVKALSICQDNIPLLEGFPTDPMFRRMVEKSFENVVKQRKVDNGKF